MKTILLSLLLSVGVLCLAPGADFAVTSTSDAGPGTLRAAILSANASAGSDTITVSPVGATITLASALPTITGDVAITGPGAAA